MRNVSEAVREKLRAEMESLKTLSRDQLKTRWKDLYGIEVPLRFSRDLLMRSVAYRMQERVLGGLKPGVRRLLEKVTENASKWIPGKVSIPTKVLPGTILIRDWGGVRHEVTVLEDGVMFRGKHHRSLSSVAHLITGSHWSGPMFLGLKAAARSGADGAR
jgi:hypothetical protein